MPKGPRGEKRPADVIGAAVMVARIATGEIAEPVEDDGKDPATKALGKKGGRARADKLTAEQRSGIAREGGGEAVDIRLTLGQFININECGKVFLPLHLYCYVEPTGGRNDKWSRHYFAYHRNSGGSLARDHSLGLFYLL